MIRRRPVVPNGVMGMLIFVTAEVMFFAGMMSAFTIVRASSLPLMWPPSGQPRLPAAATAFNTAALLASAVALFFACQRYRKSKGGVGLLTACLGLGTLFVGLQGLEWFALMKQGLTLTSSNLGSFFYLIVGFHAAHAVVALGFLAWAALKLRGGTLQPGFFYTAQACWYFVVGMWPVIYARIYF